MAAREAVRRRGQSLLVVGGLMIGSAAITASLIGADSNQESFVLDAYRAWGRVDLTASAGSTFFSEDVVERIEADPASASHLDGISGAIQVVGSVSDLTRRQGESAVTLIGFDPGRQRGFGAFVLSSGERTFGEDLGVDGVLLSTRLAAELRAKVGDELTVQAEQAAGRAEMVSLRVAGIARSLGPGAFGLRPTVFAPLPVAQRIVGIESINQIWISVRGGLRGTEALASRAAGPIAKAVEGAGEVDLKVREVKKDSVEAATTSTEFLRAMLVAMSLLIVAAGAALVVNLIMMLAEERRPRLGVLRALGLTRWKLVQMSVIEGAMYSLAAAAIGTAIGIPAGRLVAARFASAFSQFFGGDADFHFVFSVKPRTLAVAFAGGALVTLITVAAAARRTSRLSIPAAIRDLPEPARERSRPWLRWLGIAVPALVGASLVAMSLAMDNGRFPRFIGGILLILAAGSLMKPRLSSRAHSTLLGAALALWAFVMTSTLSDPTVDDPNEFFAVFVVAVLFAVFGLSIMAAANLRSVEKAATVLGRRSGSITRNLRAPLAYLARRPLRTGLTTGMFAVIMAILALFSVFLFTFRPQYERDSAGYEVRVTSTGASSLELPSSVGADVARVAELPTLGYIGPAANEQFSAESIFIPLYQADPSLGARQPVRLTVKDARFETDAEVWEAMFHNPRFIVTNFYSPGQEVVLTSAEGPVTFEVIGGQQSGIVDGFFGSRQAFAPFAELPRGTTLLVDVKEGASARAVAARIEEELFTVGVDAQTTRRLLDAGYRATKTFFSVIDILMRMGLVVGILSLGILGLRAVVERRHVIGVLRAIGYRRRGVMGGLIAEAGVTATLGVVVGVLTGMVMGYLFVRQQAGTTAFGLDMGTLGSILALVYAAVLLVTLGPAWRASRLPPAEAVRYSE